MRALAIALAMAPALAAADPSPLVHADAGFELAGSPDATSTSFRAQALLGTAFGGGRARPELAAGAMFGAGTLYAADPRAVDGAVGLDLVTYGPTVQVGLQLYKDGEPTTRLFASLAYLRVDLDKRLMIDPVPTVVPGDRGQRAAVGINFARSEVRRAAAASPHDGTWMLFLLPQQAELSTERDAGSTRYGVTLSWGS